MQKKLLALILITTLFSITAAAEYEIITEENADAELTDDEGELQDILEDVNFDHMSPNHQVGRIIVLRENGEPVNESELDHPFDFTYDTEQLSMSRDMIHLSEGFWMANFTSGESTDNPTIDYELDLEDDTVETENEDLEFGELEIQISKDFEGPQRAGREDREYEVEVYDGGSQITDFEEHVFNLRFTNGTWTSTEYPISCVDDTCTTPSELTLPEGHNTTYSVNIIAENEDGDGNHVVGERNDILETLPAIEGEFINMESANCEQNAQRCEPDAEINVGFNITTSTAENVELELMSEDESETWITVDEMDVVEEELQFEHNITFPAIDRTSYSDTLILRARAEADVRETIEDYHIEYNPFRISEDLSSPFERGLTQEFAFSVDTPYTGIPLEHEENEINSGTIEIINSDTGEQYHSFDINEFSPINEEGKYQRDVDLDLDMETGTYNFIVEITDENGHTEEESFGFTVQELETPFLIENDQINLEVDTTGEYEYTTEIENVQDETTGINYTVNESIENTVSIDQEEITLEPESTQEIGILFDLDEVEDQQGNITFEHNESEYTKDLQINIESPECFFTEETICSETPQNETYTIDDETGERSRSLTVRNFEDDVNATADVQGNLTDHITLNETEFLLEDSYELDYTLDPTLPGNFTGIITISAHGDNLEYNRVLQSTVTPEDLQVELPSTINFGTIVEEDDVETELLINNTGEMPINQINITANDVNLEQPEYPDQVEPGDAQEINLQFTEVSTTPGFLEVELGGTEDSITREIDLDATFTINVEEEGDELLQNLADLQREHSNIPIDIRDDIDDSRDLIDEAQLEWSDEQYESAEEKLEDARELYQSANTELQTLDQGTGEGGNGDTGTQQPANGEEGQEGDGVGILLPIIIVVVLLLVVGFVIYSSIELEPGDPLYDVLEQ